MAIHDLTKNMISIPINQICSLMPHSAATKQIYGPANDLNCAKEKHNFPASFLGWDKYVNFKMKSLQRKLQKKPSFELSKICKMPLLVKENNKDPEKDTYSKCRPYLGRVHFILREIIKCK